MLLLLLLMTMFFILLHTIHTRIAWFRFISPDGFSENIHFIYICRLFSLALAPAFIAFLSLFKIVSTQSPYSFLYWQGVRGRGYMQCDEYIHFLAFGCFLFVHLCAFTWCNRSLSFFSHRFSSSFNTMQNISLCSFGLDLVCIHPRHRRKFS